MFKIIKWALIAIILFGAFMFYYGLFFGEKDAWVCEAGKWVQYGNPSADMPTEKCK